MLFSFGAQAQLSGNYTIGGTSPDYLTIREALDSLATNGVSSAVVFNIRDGVYDEQVAIYDTITGTSPTNTITFQSEANDSTAVTILYSGGNEVLSLSNTNHLIFKNISFYVPTYYGTYLTSCNNLRFESVSLVGDVNNTYYLFYASYCTDLVLHRSMLSGSSGYGINGSGDHHTGWEITECAFSNMNYRGINLYQLESLLISNNTFNLGHSNTYSIYLEYCENATIEDNDITCQEQSARGIYVSSGQGNTIDDNTIQISGQYSYGIECYSNEAVISNNTLTIAGEYSDAIYVSSTDGVIRDNTITITANNVDAIYASSGVALIEDNTVSYGNGTEGGQGIYLSVYDPATVQRNKITGVNNGYGMYISNLQAVSGERGLIANNFVQISGEYNGYGIYLSTIYYTDILHNTISNTNTDSYSTALYYYYGENNRILNNVLAADHGYAIRISSSGLTACDYNNLYSEGEFIGDFNGNYLANLADWRATSNFDQHSVSADPQFASASDLHVSQIVLNGTALGGLGILTDIDGETRSSSPDIGADEFSVIGLDAGLTYIAPSLPLPPNPANILLRLSATASVPVTAATITWSVNGTPQTPFNWTGSLAENTSEQLNLGSYAFAAGGTYSLLFQISSVNGGAMQLSALNDTIRLDSLRTAMAGEYTIGGEMPDFQTFTEAIASLYDLGVADAVTFLVRDSVYHEQLYFYGAIDGASASKPVLFRSESMDANAVEVFYENGSVFYAQEVSFLQFEHLSFRAGYEYSYVVDARECNGFEWRNCRFTAAPTSSTTNVYFTDVTVGPVVEDCEFRYGYSGFYSNANGSASGSILQRNTFQDVWQGIELNGYQLSPLVNQNSIQAANGYAALRFSSLRGSAQITNNTIIYQTNENQGSAIYYESGEDDGGTPVMANNAVSISGNGQIFGIRTYGAENLLIVHNSIRISSPQVYASALEMYYGHGCNVVNNVFVNAGAGYAVTDYNGDHTYDYNDYYTTGANLAAKNDNPLNNLSAWQAATGQDAHSLSVDPFFISDSDLHVQAPALDSAGVAGTGITTDFDGEMRNPMNPDIGADEFELLAANAALTALVAPLPPVNSGVQQVQVSLYNFGVQTLTQTAIAWTVNGLPQTTYNWSGSLETGDSLHVIVGSFDFSGGEFDVVFISQNPNDAPDENPDNDTLRATIKTALIGTYTIGADVADFETIAEAVDALLTRGAEGDVIFEIQPGTYAEQAHLSDFPGNGVYHITFRSQAGDANSVLWQYESTNDEHNYVLKLDNVSLFTFEQLHIKALENYYYGVVVNLTNADDITFRENRLEGTESSYSDFARRIIFTNTASPATVCENLQLINNQFLKGGYALYFETQGSITANTITIQGNTFENQRTALVINNVNNSTIENNVFSATHSSGSYNGLTMYNGQTTLISGNTFSATRPGTAFSLNTFTGKAEVLKNKISGTSTGVSFGGLNTSTRSLIANNFIQVGNAGTGYGIQGQGNSKVDIYHNSVLNVAISTTVQSNINNGAIILNSSGGNYKLKNNTFSSTGGGFAISLSTSNTYESDYNNLHQVPNGLANILGLSQNNYRRSLAEWQTANPALDDHSVSVLPAFFSDTDLHLNQASLNNAGTPLAEVTTDIDGDARDATTPDIGADEFDLSSDDILPLAFLSPTNACANDATTVKVVLRNVGVNDATGFSLKLLRNNVEVANENVGAFSVMAGDTAHYTFIAPLDLGTPGAYQIAVITQLTGDGDTGNDTLRTNLTSYAFPTATAGSNSPVCENETINLTSSGGASYEWSGPDGFTSSQQNPEVYAYSAVNNSGLYQVIVTNANGCKDTAQVAVTVDPAPMASATSNSPVCESAAIQLFAEGDGNYLWSGPNGFSSNVQNPEITDAALEDSGDYYLTVTDANGCEGYGYVYVEVTEAGGSVDSNSPVCAGETLQLTASGGNSYLWSGPDGFSSTEAEPFIELVTTAAAGTYSVTISTGSGCDQVLTVNVVVNALPAAAIAPSAITICGGTPTTLTASGGGSYLWSTGPTANNINVSPTETTTYDVSVTSAAGCTQTASATITVNNNAPYFAFTGNTGYEASAVEPQTGSPYQTFYFEIDYFDADGHLPTASFPRLLLDFNNDGNYNGADDRVFVMTPADVSDTDVTDGKRYFHQASGLNTSFNYRTAFLAQDAAGCQSLPFTPVDEPNVVDFADIHIYANDIVFSNNNPDPGTPLDVAATIHNDSDFDALDFVVRLVNQYNSQIYTDITVANLPAHSTTTVNWTIITPDEVSWNPMQVFIDFTNVIDEPNELNNQAIRPFVNGEYNLPGEIAVTAAASPEESLSGSSGITISGTAIYQDTAVPLSDPSVAGATVTFTLVETGQTFSAYTNSQGQFARSFQPPLTPGLYHVIGSITDFTLTGNFTAQFVIQPGPCQPDLSCTFQMSTNSVFVGGSATGSITVRNNGCAPSAIASLLDVSGTNGSPIPGDAIIPALQPGEAFTYTFSNPINFNTLGTATLQATADAAFAIVESSEQNNFCAASIAVNPTLPDIAIGYVASGGQKYLCQEQGFTIRIDNNGGVGTGAFQLVRHVVRLSDNQLEYADTVTINNVSPGAYGSVYSSFNHTFEETGNYRIDAFADIPTFPGTGVVAELNEANNTGSVGATLIPCQLDLRLDGVVSVSPVDAHAAPSVMATVQLSNVGTTATTGEVVVAFVIGLDTVYTTYPNPIAAGATVQVSATLPSPGLNCASLFAKADFSNLIAEVSEANNTLLSQLTYDFYPGNYCSYTASKFWQTTQFINRPVEFRVGLFNEGYFAASSVKVKFEISGPGISGWLDWGFNTVSPVGKTGSCPYTVAAPTEYVFSQIGTYQVRITVDPDGDYSECNEGNNVMIVPVTVAEERADLRILSQYIAPSKLNPDVGEPVTLDITYENIGINNIGETFKLAWEVNEIGQDTVDAIGLNQGDINTLTMPSMWSSTIPGIHIIRAKIDALETVEENSEQNNEATRAILVGQYPNLYFENLMVSNDAPAVGEEIELTFDVPNEGDLSCNADVQIFYVNDFSDTILLQTFSITVPENDVRSFTRSIHVYDAATTLVLRIINADPEEFNTTDNEATLQLGVLSVSAALQQAESCPGSADGTATVSIVGGQGPYIVQWSNNATGTTLTATAGSYQVSVTDGAANTATAAVVITTAEDDLLPLIFGGPGDVSVTVTDGICPAVVNWTEPQATDNCGLDTLYSNYEPGDSFNPGPTMVTYTAIDASGNVRTYSFNVIVNAQPIALAGDNQIVCGSTTSLSAIPPPLGTGEWSVVSGAGNFANPSDPATTISDLAAGLNVLQWEVTNGTCGSDTALVEIVHNATGIIHVSQNATGANNGTDWANAFTSLATALDFAASCTPATLWIAEGIYLPTVGNDRNASFDIPTQTTLLGGFNGTETAENQRRPAEYRTILSGDINSAGASDNSYHVVKVETAGVLLDGLHITAGRADGSVDNAIGGGLFFVPNEAATLNIRNTNFYNNTAQTGGAIGVIANGIGVVVNLTNITFAGNEASMQGGAIAASQNSGGTTLLDLLHVSFGDNIANGIGTSGSALYLDGAAANVRNSILWNDGDEIMSGGSVTISNSIVRGGAAGTNVLNADPRYDDAAASDLRLTGCSPAIDAGAMSGIPMTDITLGNRVYSSMPDLGAFEFDGTDQVPPILSASNEALSATMEFTDANGWTHYYYCSNDGAGDRIVMSILKDGQDIGELGNNLMVRNVTTANYANNSAYDLSNADYVENPSWYVIGRYWDVDTDEPVADSIRVRYYYTGKDTADIKTAMEAVGGLWVRDTSLYFFKVSGMAIDPFDEDVIASGGTYNEYRHGPTPSLSTWTKGVFNGLMYAEYYVSSFSGGGGGGSPGLEGPTGALPVELISFEGQRLNDRLVQLNWQTAQELDIAGYEVQRSADGRTWTKVGYVPGLGNNIAGHSYPFTDENALHATSYYRLRIIGTDATVEFSNVVAVEGNKGVIKLALAPNPTSGAFSITMEAADLAGQLLELQVTNSAGQGVYQQVFTPGAARWTQEVGALAELPAGLYNVVIRKDGKVWQMGRVVKE